MNPVSAIKMEINEQRLLLELISSYLCEEERQVIDKVLESYGFPALLTLHIVSKSIEIIGEERLFGHTINVRGLKWNCPSCGHFTVVCHQDVVFQHGIAHECTEGNYRYAYFEGKIVGDQKDPIIDDSEWFIPTFIAPEDWDPEDCGNKEDCGRVWLCEVARKK